MKISRHINQLWKRDGSLDDTYLFFATLRFVLVFIPQVGYIHPDEFFQSVEIMTGEHFQLEHTRTWEFNNTMPLRSITIPFIMLRIPWSFFEFFAMYFRQYAGLNVLYSYSYLVFPRLLMCCLSFVVDFCMLRVCRIYSLRHEIRLLALGSSWVMLVFGTRTFSNTIEMVLSSALLLIVSECMIRTNTIVYKKELLEEKYEKAESIGERVKMWKLKNALPEHNYKHIFLLSSICVAGVFNRPTFLLYGAPMVFYWMLRGLGTKTITFTDFNLRMLLFCLSSIPAMVFFVLCDSFYYKYLTAGELHMLELGINNFVFTPWNFVKYNLNPDKTAQHGLHPRYVHLLANIPMLYNILGVIAMVSFGQIMIRFFKAEYQGLPRAQSIVSLMSGAIFVPLFFLSLINHQEPRFLIPMTFPLILLHAPKLVTGFCAAYPFKEEHPFLRSCYNRVLCTQVSAKYLLKIWYTCNIALTVFFGFIHQAGVFPLAQHMEQIMQSKSPIEHVHLVTSHIYSLPVHFVNVPNSKALLYNYQTGQRYRRQKDFYLYEFGSRDMIELSRKLKLIASNCETKLINRKLKYQLFLAIPSSLSDDFTRIMNFNNISSYMNYELERIIYPHLSTEAFPRLWTHHPCDIHAPAMSDDDLKGICAIEPKPSLSTGYLIHQFSSFIHQFGLALYKIEVRHKTVESKSPPPPLSLANKSKAKEIKS